MKKNPIFLRVFVTIHADTYELCQYGLVLELPSKILLVLSYPKSDTFLIVLRPFSVRHHQSSKVLLSYRLSS